MLNEYPSWDRVKADYPSLAKILLDEFNRCNGFIPYEPGFIYVIHAVGSDFYKIGKTTNPDRRILQVAPQMPFPTRYVRVWRSMFMSMAEKSLHSSFEKYRTNGEWFKLGSDQLVWLLGVLENRIRYTYVDLIFYRFISVEDEWSRFRREFGNVLNVDFRGAFSMSVLENLFQEISSEPISALPEDLIAMIRNYGSETEEV